MSRLWAGYRRRQGTVLLSVLIVTTLWLAVTGQLILYVHPQHAAFAVVMALVGLVFVVASFVRSAEAHHADGHDHSDPDDRPVTGWQQVFSVVSVAVTLVMAVALVVVPPTTLTAATANQREINSTGLGDVADGVDLAERSAGTFANFTVRDWAALLRQTTDIGFYAEMEADVTGFITADGKDPENSFYVSRFVVTHCAVDAQPVGVQVYLPDWQGTFQQDQWVEVSGAFATNPSRSSDQPIALIPADITQTEQPGEPYLY